MPAATGAAAVCLGASFIRLPGPPGGIAGGGPGDPLASAADLLGAPVAAQHLIFRNMQPLAFTLRLVQLLL